MVYCKFFVNLQKFYLLTFIIMDKLQELQRRLLIGEVRFSFRKNNGEIRITVGTLVKEKCPMTSGSGRPTPEHLQLYFDVEKGAWRSFKKDEFIDLY